MPDRRTFRASVAAYLLEFFAFRGRFRPAQTQYVAPSADGAAAPRRTAKPTRLTSRYAAVAMALVAALMGLAFWWPGPAESGSIEAPPADAAALAAVVHRFAPQVRLHPEERYFPSSVAWYLERTQVHTPARVSLGDLPTLMSTRGAAGGESERADAFYRDGARFAQKMEETLEEKLAKSSFAKYFLKIKKDRPDRELAARLGELESAKTYVHLRKPSEDGAGLDIQYWFFYPYSGPVLAGPAGGAHEGDWEHITVRLDPSLQRVEKIFFAAHDREGSWVAAEDVQFVEYTHPVVYSARYGHASYPSAGIQSRGMLPADRTADGGAVWQTWENLKIIADASGLRQDIPWLGYAGRWGRTGVLFSGPRGPAFQRYWHAEH